MAQQARRDPLHRGSLHLDREEQAGTLPAAGDAFDKYGAVAPRAGVTPFYEPYEYGFRASEARAWDALYFEEGGEGG